jgi:hypothetical protein
MIAAMESLKAAQADEKESLTQRMTKMEVPTFGATGKFPDGSIDKTDEGEIIFSLSSHRSKVIINFGKPVSWLGLDARQAGALAVALIQHANSCRDIGSERKSEVAAKEHA